MPLQIPWGTLQQDIIVESVLQEIYYWKGTASIRTERKSECLGEGVSGRREWLSVSDTDKQSIRWPKGLATWVSHFSGMKPTTPYEWIQESRRWGSGGSKQRQRLKFFFKLKKDEEMKLSLKGDLRARESFSLWFLKNGNYYSICIC